METKKYEHQRIERKIPLFYMLGLNVAILLTILAFEIKTDKVDIVNIPVDVDRLFPPDELFREIKQKIPVPTNPQFKPTDVEVSKEDPIIDEPPIDLTEIGTPDGEPDLPDLPPPPVEEPEPAPFDIVEEMPSYPGGWEAFYKFVGKNTKFTSQAKRMGIEGKVYAKFIIEKDGSISDLHIIKPLGAGLDEEAIRVLKLIPQKFNPGKQRGRPVRVSKVLPINFQLHN